MAQQPSSPQSSVVGSSVVVAATPSTASPPVGTVDPATAPPPTTASTTSVVQGQAGAAGDKAVATLTTAVVAQPPAASSVVSAQPAAVSGTQAVSMAPKEGGYRLRPQKLNTRYLFQDSQKHDHHSQGSGSRGGGAFWGAAGSPGIAKAVSTTSDSRPLIETEDRH